MGGVREGGEGVLSVLDGVGRPMYSLHKFVQSRKD
jgi:hypothetical protein